MTFSLAARAADGAFGMVVSSSSPAVAARCTHLAAGVGVIASQNITDPTLGHRGLQFLRAGYNAHEVLDRLALDAHIDYRQLAVVDVRGAVASYSGTHTLGVHASAHGEGCVASGNLLADRGVPEAMVAAFEGADGDLEDRLLQALKVGMKAGGEAGPVRSAGLAVVEDVGWRVTDLRVDDHDFPIEELARLLEVWRPEKQRYVVRAVDPGRAPSFGVAGDR